MENMSLEVSRLSGDKLRLGIEFNFKVDGFSQEEIDKLCKDDGFVEFIKGLKTNVGSQIISSLETWRSCEQSDYFKFIFRE